MTSRDQLYIKEIFLFIVKKKQNLHSISIHLLGVPRLCKQQESLPPQQNPERPW